MTGKELIFKVGQEVMKHEKDKNFNLDDPTLEFYYQSLYRYFLGDINGPLNPNKCLLITGSKGLGKTVMFKVMQRIFRKFYWVEALQLKSNVIQNSAMQTLNDYGYNLKKDLLIDDLGLEDPLLKLWGTEPNIFADLFHQRHRLFVDHGIKTHIITNMNDEELDKYYGERVVDRILGDCEGATIVMTGKTLRHSLKLEDNGL